MTRRNYDTPGRKAATAMTKTEPGAPRAKKNDGQFKPKAEQPADGEPPLAESKIVWRDESVFEKDPDFPPSKVKLEEHPAKRDVLIVQIVAFQAAGFLPVAVSRLVGLRPRDVAALTASYNRTAK